ncbi:MAG: hypothetical protein QXQ57_08030 [Sulfolobales archaeon]
MDLVDFLHVAVVISALVLAIIVFIRIYRSGFSSDESYRYEYSIVEQQVMPQLIIIGRYIKRLIFSWEYLLLVIALVSLALIASYPYHVEPYYIAARAQRGVDLPDGVLILYSPKGINMDGNLSEVIMKVYYVSLGEPIVIHAGDKILRIFSLIAIDCGLFDPSLLVGESWREILSICPENNRTYVYPPNLYSGDISPNAILYYSDKGLNTSLKPFPIDILGRVKRVACLGEILNDIFRQITYSGGAVIPADLLRGSSIDLGSPNVVISKGDFRRILSNDTLSKLGVELACYREHASTDIIRYIRVGGEGNGYTYSLLAGLASSSLLILFNRSYMLRISPSSNAILISGGTAWMSSVFPLVSLASIELLAMLAFVSIYGIGRVFLFQGDKAVISPPGVLIIFLTSFLGSVVHLLIVRSRAGFSSAYMERIIPARNYSSVIEGYTPKDLVSVVLAFLEKSEFFDVVEKEIFEHGDRVNARLRLIYRYAMGVGADVSIYVSTHNNGSFLDVDIEPWSIDARESGVLNSISRLIISRISGGIVVDKISRDSSKS